MPQTKSKKDEYIYCHKCGTKNGSDTKFCKECGAQLHREDKTKGEAVVQKEEKVKEVKEQEKSASSRMPIWMYALIIIIVLVIGGFVYVYLHSNSSNNLSNINSSYKTPSNQCATNSQCSAGYYCSSFNTCVKDYCGDGVCTPQKQQSNSCPIDCGCPSGEVLNKYSGTCQQSLTINATTITNIVKNYLKQNNINGTITAIKDSYYGSQAVKEADVNCQTNQSKYPCGIIFYINSNGNIINVTRTS